MKDALGIFLDTLKDDGRIIEVEKDQKGVEFIAVDVGTLRKYIGEILNLVHYKCIGYVSVKKRGRKEMARLQTPPDPD